MIKIDLALLQEIGLGTLPDAEKNSLLKHIYDTLEMRVGMRLADQMTNEQLDEFERYYENKDDAGAFKWLETNFPNYKDIVQEEFDKLRGEVAQSAPQILSSSQAAQAQQLSQLPANDQFAAPMPNPQITNDTTQQPFQTVQQPAANPMTPPLSPMQPQPYTEQTQQPPQYPIEQPPAGPPPAST